jgi:hypothetical protein
LNVKSLPGWWKAIDYDIQIAGSCWRLLRAAVQEDR